MTAIILHEDPVSGNCYKIRLTAAHLGIPIERRGYDILKGETRTDYPAVSAWLARVAARPGHIAFDS